MTALWLTWRYLFTGKNFFSSSSLFAVGGLSVGVASLVVAMAVFSGFETTLVQAITDNVGHLTVDRRDQKIFARSQSAETKIRELTPGFSAAMAYAVLEGAVAHNGKVAGVYIEGVEAEHMQKVMRLTTRLSSGAIDFSQESGVWGAVIGKGVAKRFGLKVGDIFRVVHPSLTAEGSSDFRARLARFRVSGVVALGLHEYDERYIITEMTATQELAQVKDQISGWKVRLKDQAHTDLATDTLGGELGYPYRIASWRAVNPSLVRAVQMEKPVIFFVVLIMVIAAGFNVCCHLFVSVLQRFADIAILKAMGASAAMIIAIFAGQGLILGLCGALSGLLLGWLLCFGFVWSQKTFNLLPGEVYRLDFVFFDVRSADVVWIVASVLLICLLATLVPAWRGSRLAPVEGLRYE